MIQELDTVVLDRDINGYPLKAGDVGAVVYCYADGATYEVEFVTGDGDTVAVLTLPATDLRPMHQAEILHVRSLALA